ncbi:MAG: GNAT family N-acetyltransferase [Candidatus Binataceae bacterium]
MARTALVRDFIRYEGLSRLPRTVLKALTPLDFHIFALQRGDSPRAAPLPAGVAVYENALERLQARRGEQAASASEFWRDKINGASRCAIIECGEELAGVGWVYEYPAQRPLLLLAPGTAEMSGFYVLARFRGRGFYRMLLHGMVEGQMRRQRQLFMVAAGDNPRSISAIAAAGFREAAIIRRRPIGGGPKFAVAAAPIAQPAESNAAIA